MQASIVRVGAWLKESGYHFVTPTPLTHARVNARGGHAQAHDLRGVFGWSRPFAAALLPGWVVQEMDGAGLLSHEASLLRSRLRFSSLGEQLFAHSAFPTTDADSVFFGPDTYRFADLIQSELARTPLRSGARILDIGCGAGPGGIIAARMAPVEGLFDFIVANPPYLVDAGERTYRHGGGRFGEGLAGRIVAEGLPLLTPGGRLVLYSGSAVVDGTDTLLESLRPGLQECSWPFTWHELDPDVFGEELDAPAYAQAERIAAVALVVQRPS